jgi:hypothetical protein
MAVVINDFEVTPAATQERAGGRKQEGMHQAQPESAKKIEKTMQVQHERKLRLAAY